MHDPRIDRLADILLDHSCELKPGERVLIEAFDLPDATLVCRLVEGAAKRGGVPLVSWKSNTILRSLYQAASEESMKLAGEFESARMEKMQAYIGVRGAANSSQFADVPQAKMDLYQEHWWKAVHTDVRISNDSAVRARVSSSAKFVRSSTSAVWPRPQASGDRRFASTRRCSTSPRPTSSAAASPSASTTASRTPATPPHPMAGPAVDATAASCARGDSRKRACQTPLSTQGTDTGRLQATGCRLHSRAPGNGLRDA